MGVHLRGTNVLCPSCSWAVRMSIPRSRKRVAWECRRVWQLAGVMMFALRVASLTARCIVLSSRWWRPYDRDLGP
jgi:hypothetical protein